MEILNANQKPWKEIKEIYMEAFPKAERKPFFTVRRSVNKGKSLLLTAMENEVLQGFVMAIPYKNMVMVDYLAVSSKIRSRGTGSKMMQEICRYFPGEKIVLLIERLDDTAENKDQRIARRRFYFKNGFTSSNIYITGRSGNMEILNFGGTVSKQEYMDLQQHALGKLMFRLSGIQLAV
ncbi:GNAT family N-acetyltransferase [Subdoligranulum sp. AM23-21AC]|nr:GNAT family N-acetyltransferase [Ruthenibacterium lactatiformans]MCQ5089646.1 GNAT family N-acetyltransferase [Ruthenibacterium lactatiformans]RGD18669.1 GNAT family N-acetyltransferase [Subdoligranulum sp. AM23-21AC]RJV97748.1 GNAT family N-acetyltransferase [Subdoligranulum sp. AF14-43]RJW25850.1 GNAT family N-acetyltransferase [Subdoligranulum sp. TF05-17AC]